MILSLISSCEALGRIAESVRRIRLEANITQQELADRSGVSIAVIRKFERTGMISLESFVKLVLVLGLADNILDMLKKYENRYHTIDELLDSDKPKRMRARK